MGCITELKSMAAAFDEKNRKATEEFYIFNKYEELIKQIAIEKPEIRANKYFSMTIRHEEPFLTHSVIDGYVVLKPNRFQHKYVRVPIKDLELLGSSGDFSELFSFWLRKIFVELI